MPPIITAVTGTVKFSLELVAIDGLISIITSTLYSNKVIAATIAFVAA